MPYAFGERSSRVLETVHPMLQELLRYAINHGSIDFAVVSGRRTPEEQAEKVRLGYSTTTHSKHVTPAGSPALAVDIAPWEPGGIPWKDTHKFYRLAGYVERMAEELGLAPGLRWGSHWERFHDPGHIEVVREVRR